MAQNALQRLLDAGVEFTNISRKQAESIVSSLVKAGEVRRADAEQAVQDLLARGRETTDRLADSVQREVAKQIEWMSERFDELEDRFEELSERVQGGQPAKKAPAKKAPAKKKAAAKKKAPAKKAPAKKQAAGSD